MSLDEAIQFVDRIDVAYPQGEEPLQASGIDRKVLRSGSSEKRRRLIAERHFDWERWSHSPTRWRPE